MRKCTQDRLRCLNIFQWGAVTESANQLYRYFLFLMLFKCHSYRAQNNSRSTDNVWPRWLFVWTNSHFASCFVQTLKQPEKKKHFHPITFQGDKHLFHLMFSVCYANMFKLVQVSLTGEKKDMTKIFLASHSTQLAIVPNLFWALGPASQKAR